MLAWVQFRGQTLGERVTLEPEDRVTFERTHGPVLGTIRNEILEDRPGELELRFSFDLVLEGVEAGSQGRLKGVPTYTKPLIQYIRYDGCPSAFSK